MDLFAFAGVWDRWQDPSGNWMKTCSILTTIPNAVTSAVHDRMPVILDLILTTFGSIRECRTSRL